jgi:hypothetical protein
MTPRAGAGGAIGAAGASGVAGAAGMVMAAAGRAAVAGGCPGAEKCQLSSIGSQKFCSAMTLQIPPSCPTAGAACGTDGKGSCFDAGALMPVLAGMLYCLYPACMM